VSGQLVFDSGQGQTSSRHRFYTGSGAYSAAYAVITADCFS